MQSHQTELNTR